MTRSLGWAVNQWGNWWHDGSLPGTSSILVRTSGGLGWAVLFNTRPENWQDFNLQMDNMVWEAVNGVTNWPTHDLFPSSAVEGKNFDSPEEFGLYQNYPNPFNNRTTIRYYLSASNDVTLKIYNNVGREVITLVNERQGGGAYQVQWNGRDATNLSVVSGIYICTLETNSFSQTRKLLLLR